MLNITLIKLTFEKSCRDYNEVHKLGSNGTRNVVDMTNLSYF